MAVTEDMVSNILKGDVKMDTVVDMVSLTLLALQTGFQAFILNMPLQIILLMHFLQYQTLTHLLLFLMKLMS